MTALESAVSPSDPVRPILPITTRGWWHRNLEPEERRRVMEELAITKVEGWTWRFYIMLSLSVVVAVMGLSANSAAVVIGAMLLAPLMNPVLASAANISLSLVGKAAYSLGKVALATIWCVGLAYGLSILIPDGPLASEIEARTRPDIRDLAVALAAGAAGSYATVRRDASSALPGVAVAVALVPPLATVGITLEAGKIDLALGAGLLYVTNLAAIVFAGVMVFIATGFVPPRRLANTAARLLVAFSIGLAVVVAITVPLYGRSVAVVKDVQDEVIAERVVREWLNGADLSPDVDVSHDRVLVRLRGFDPPPDDASLKQDLAGQIGEVTVVVEWVRTERATTTTARVATDEERLGIEARPIVEQWLNEHKGVDEFDITRLRAADGVLRIDATGADEPPPVDDLVRRLHSQLTPDLDAAVNWTPRRTIRLGTTTTIAAEQVVERELISIAEDWAATAGVSVESATFDGEQIVIHIAGPTAPITNALLVRIQAEISGQIPIDVLFSQRQRLTTLTIIDPDLLGPIDLVPGFTDTTVGGDSSAPDGTALTPTVSATTVPGG